MKSELFIAWKVFAASILATLASSGARAQSGTNQFSSLAYSVNESGGSARITVSRTGGSAGTVTINFATMDSAGGTATAGKDYISTNGTLILAPGITSRFFNVPIIDDAEHEPNETVIIELQGDFVGDRNQATLTILDNDPCLFSLNPTSQNLDSGGGLAPAITVTATEGCDWTVSKSVDWIGITDVTKIHGGGQVVYSFDPNPGTRPRSASLTIAGKTFLVTQLGVPAPDLTPPIVTITSPAPNSRQTNAEITVTGKARDNVAVTLVEVRLENAAGISDYVAATGTTNWTAIVSGLIPGTNTLRVRARDADNAPAEITRPVFFVDVRPLALATVGNGLVTPLVNGQLLEVGRNYSLQAKPARNNFFAGWSGSLESAANPLTFEMQPDLMLQANFVLSPFLALAGTYNGLFLEEADIRQDRCGFLTVKVADLGGFTAKLIVGGKRLSFSGKFALDGKSTNAIPRPGSTPLTVVLCLDLVSGTDQLTGFLSPGDWQVNLLADRARFNASTNPATQAGRYTLIVSGDDDDPANHPGGDSFAVVTVDANGSVKLSATLADGTKATQKVPLAQNGSWPLYVPLYGGHGSILSWVTFAANPDSDFTGTLTWIKPSLPSAKLYPAGFALRQAFSGSSYRPPTNRTDRILTFSDGRVQFRGGNLAEDFANAVSLTDDNKVLNLATNKLSLTFSLATGLFRGSVTVPGTTRSLPFNGAVYQKRHDASGFFSGTNQSGRVLLSP